MIIGNLNCLDNALLPAPLKALLNKEECSFAQLSNKEDGRYDILDNTVFYIVSSPMTAPENTLKSEFHEQFIDIQVLLSGHEVIATSNTITQPHPYQACKPDLLFVDDDQLTTRIVLAAGDFAIFYPGEVHRPTCQQEEPTRIKKVVFKVCKDWLANQ